MSMKPLKAPSPVVGDCDVRAQWSDPSFVGQCKQCVSQPDMFFCDGECLDKYSSETCSTDSPVAKTAQQCESPCKQVAFPPMGGCSDKWDCDWKRGEICEMVFSPKQGGMVGMCKMGVSGGKTDGSKTEGGKTDGSKTEGGKTDGGDSPFSGNLAAVKCNSATDCGAHQSCVLRGSEHVCEDSFMHAHKDMVIAITIMIILAVFFYFLLTMRRR